MCKENKNKWLLAHDWMMKASKASPHSLYYGANSLAICNFTSKVNILFAFGNFTPLHSINLKWRGMKDREKHRDNLNTVAAAAKGAKPSAPQCMLRDCRALPSSTQFPANKQLYGVICRILGGLFKEQKAFTSMYHKHP